MSVLGFLLSVALPLTVTKEGESAVVEAFGLTLLGPIEQHFVVRLPVDYRRDGIVVTPPKASAKFIEYRVFITDDQKLIKLIVANSAPLRLDKCLDEQKNYDSWLSKTFGDFKGKGDLMHAFSIDNQHSYAMSYCEPLPQTADKPVQKYRLSISVYNTHAE